MVESTKTGADAWLDRAKAVMETIKKNLADVNKPDEKYLTNGLNDMYAQADFPERESIQKNIQHLVKDGWPLDNNLVAVQRWTSVSMATSVTTNLFYKEAPKKIVRHFDLKNPFADEDSFTWRLMWIIVFCELEKMKGLDRWLKEMYHAFIDGSYRDLKH